MEGSEKRIEMRDVKKTIEDAGLSAVVADLQKRHNWKPFGLAAEIEAQREKPVWQQPSLAGGRDPIKPSHYTRHKIEPWDYVAANGLGYFEGSAIKYLTRWPYKNGVVDLKKARAFIDKLIAVEEAKLVRYAGQEVGGQPAADHAEHGADRRDRAE